MIRSQRTSSVLVIALTLAVVGGLVSTVGYGWAVTVGGFGVLLLAVVLQVQTADSYRALVGVGTALAMPVVGGALLLSTGDVLADQVRAAAPPGAAPFVGSVLLAVFGATLTARGSLDRSSLVRTLGVGIRVVLLLAATIAVFATIQFTALGSFLGVVSEAAILVVFAPPSGMVFLGSWLALVALAVGGVAAALRSLPFTELLVDSQRREWVQGVSRQLTLVVVPIVAATLLTIALEAAGDPYAGFPAPLTSLLAALTGSSLLRGLLVLLAVGTLIPATGARLVKQGYRTDPHSALVTAGPYIGAGIVILRALGASGNLVTRIRTGLADRVPGPLEPNFQEFADRVVSFYGEELLALIAVFVLVAIAVVVLGVLMLGVLISLVPEHNSGPALAGTGVFAAAAFAIILGIPLWAGLVGAVAGMVVRDAGGFGSTLTQELGDVASARTELLHAGGSASVGAVTGFAALAVAWVATGLPADSGPPAAALVAALVGGTLLVVASR